MKLTQLTQLTTKLTQLQKDLLIGTLLGDGSMQTFSNGKTWRYRAIHQSSQVDYLLYKYEILKELCNTEPKESSTYDSRTNKTYYRYSFNTLTNPSLRFFANLFYKIKDTPPLGIIKVVPINIELFLTPRALAFFYMDDGSLKWKGHSKAIRLCTDNFTLDDVKRLQKVLNDKYNIKSTLSKCPSGHRIEISDTSIFFELIKPFIHNSMAYKIP